MGSAEVLLNDLIKSINADAILSDQYLLDLQKEFQYYGFNALNILKKMTDHIKNNPESGKEDILKLIALGLLRGNKISNIVKTMEKSSADWLIKMKKIFNLTDKVKDNDPNSKSADKITLSRMRISAPQFALTILSISDFTRQVSLVKIHDTYEFISVFPFTCRDMCMMSLLPKTESVGYSRDAHSVIFSHIFIYCLVETTVLITPGKSLESEKSRAENVVKYMGISWNAKHVTSTMRTKIQKLLTAGIYGDDKNIMENFLEQRDNILSFCDGLGINLQSHFKLSNRS